MAAITAITTIAIDIQGMDVVICPENKFDENPPELIKNKFGGL